MMDSVTGPVMVPTTIQPPPSHSPPDGPHTPQGLSFDLESGFEPQTRARSNTWPLPRPDGYVDGNGGSGDGGGGNGVGIGKDGTESGTPPQQSGLGQGAGLLPVKKNSSRRNAWGNLSYADLITQAITSAPEKRLTLSQIYEWMVQNVPYFKDKGDSNSSAGWKNSIRHNLSLHNRFMRVQNEGTGKSSWWMINPDAKPGKSARRRATSMETSKFEKRRGRVKKKVEALRNGLQADATPSPSSSVSEGLDLFPDSPLHAGGFQLSPDFRPRASSNASSVGRLSPIPAVLGEPDWTGTYGSSYSPEQLAGNLAESMKLESYQMYQTSPPNHQQQTVPPPSYFEAQYQRNNTLRKASSPYGLPPTPQPANQQRCPIHRLQPCTCQMNLSPVSGMSPSYQSEPSTSPLGAQQQTQAQSQMRTVNEQELQYLLQSQSQTDQQNQPRQAQTRPTNSSPPQTPTSTPSTMMGQLMGALNNTTLLDDLNINIEGLHGGFDCNVDEVIKHELSMDGTLDFNFQQGIMGTAAVQVTDTAMNHGNVVTSNNQAGSSNPSSGVYATTNSTTPAAPPSWVH